MLAVTHCNLIFSGKSQIMCKDNFQSQNTLSATVFLLPAFVTKPALSLFCFKTRTSLQLASLQTDNRNSYEHDKKENEYIKVGVCVIFFSFLFWLYSRYVTLRNIRNSILDQTAPFLFLHEARGKIYNFKILSRHSTSLKVYIYKNIQEEIRVH